MDPGGSIASVWPHPLPPASVPSFADNSTPNSSPLAPSHPFHLYLSLLRRCSLRSTIARPLLPLLRIPRILHVNMHIHKRVCVSAHIQESRECVCVWARSWLYNGGVVRRDVCSRARDENLFVYVRARARVYVCGRRGGGGRARGDPFFSVSPVLSSHPFYARALLC